MLYRYNEPVAPGALADLRQAVGWNRMEQAYADPRLTSYCHIAAYEGDVLVGYIDCVSNGVTDAYIQDLMIHPIEKPHTKSTAALHAFGSSAVLFRLSGHRASAMVHSLPLST